MVIPNKQKAKKSKMAAQKGAAEILQQARLQQSRAQHHQTNNNNNNQGGSAPLLVQNSSEPKALFQITDWDSFSNMLQDSALLKVWVCKQMRCGWCTKFEPVLEATAPTMSFVGNSPQYALFYTMTITEQFDIYQKVQNEWLPRAIQEKLCPPTLQFISGGNPKFMILAGTEEVGLMHGGTKNSILDTYGGYVDQVDLLAHLEMALSGIVNSSQAFMYLPENVRVKAVAQATVLRKRKELMALRSAGGAEVKCNDPNCKVHAKKCDNPNCEVHRGGSVANSKTQATSSIPVNLWDRKLLNQQQQKDSTTDRSKTKRNKEKLSTIVPPPNAIRMAGKNSFGLIHKEQGLQTYWEYRYPPSMSQSPIHQSTLQLIDIMQRSHGIPWKIIPDGESKNIQMMVQTRVRPSKNGGSTSSSQNDNNRATATATHKYTPIAYEGTQAYNWAFNYVQSLNALHTKTSAFAQSLQSTESRYE
jgi:hypothetical protein